MIFCNAIKIVIGELKVKLTSVIKKIGEYWDQRSSGFDEEHDTEDLDAWMRSLKSLLGADINKSVLDLGAGTGFLANMTAKLGCSTIGVDISEKMLKYAVNHAESNWTNAIFMKGNVLALPFMDNAVNYIINSRLIWTLVEPDAAMILNICLRVQMKEGLLFERKSGAFKKDNQQDLMVYPDDVDIVGGSFLFGASGARRSAAIVLRRCGGIDDFG
jgi:ubiquinone/menaquinone biosynthesis C-methylase UbiE